MKLALIVDDYLPHSTRVGAKMMHELARELLLQGHKVTVITPKSGVDSSSFQSESLDGVVIWRFQSGPLKDVAKVTRVINASLLSLKDKFCLFFRILRNFFISFYN